MTDPADLVREACDLLAGLYPRLARETPEPDISECAAPGMAARPSAAPLPGNAPAIFARTGIEASARQLEAILKYAAGARRPGPLAVRPGSDASTLLALDALPGLAAFAGDDVFRLVISELEQRVTEAQSVRAIDEAQQWRAVPQRRCRVCGCWFLKVALDSRGRATRRVECFGHLPSGSPCRAVAMMGTDSQGCLGLTWPDGFTETVPDMDG